MKQRCEPVSSRRWAGSLAAIFFALGTACNQAPAPKGNSSGVDTAGMDSAASPGEDFDAYSSGRWMKATPIPADKSRYGVFAMVADETRKQLQTLIQEAAKGGAAETADSRKIGDYYTAFMDEAAIEAQGLAPLKERFDSIAVIANRRDLARILGSRLRADTDPLNNTSFDTSNLFGVWITQGLNDPSRSYPYLMQGGLGMPDRDFYISKSPHMTEMRKQYQAHVVATFRLAKFSDPEARAARVFALEMKMAGAHATRVESEDVHHAVEWKREELPAKAPGLDWPVLLEAAGLDKATVFVIWHPKAIPGLSALAAKEPLEAWKDWLLYHAIDESGSFLPKAFVEERFAFAGKALNGIPQLRPRWQRGVDFTNVALGEVVGKVYVERFVPKETKQQVQAMVTDLVKAFGARIDALAWMSPATKAKAKQKLETMRVGVAYPDKWRDYSGLEVRKGDPLGNRERSELFEYRWQLAKLTKPVDRDEWWMTPQTVNAVNLPLQNSLNFPAAMLQPPYFDPKADAAHNYGAIGATIGHEISHSFDDQGSQFDAEGRLMNWWTKEDLEHFKAAGEALAAQFDTYKPFPDLAVNGHQTLSENIADVAGLLAAYDAYRLSLGGKADLVKDGLSGDQRFFISYAQSWRSKIRDAALRAEIATDGHAPEQYRALTVRNLDPWYPAFGVKPGQKLYLAPKDRVRVW